ncbi:hypothetical protein TRAPUB_902 [Trametes pubescens]|uniref:F-box domain-containing protein n=1 Tax=Trametes pubescens TaxID=154538 RepID=A0A1M2VKQ5_TRAPU|nr:hypothetical protein TRAPUB_902 [Trametes pubescens]
MASVNKTLHDPAARTLWADLPDLVPLVKTFPEDAWETQGYQIHLSRTLSLSDWASFLKYCRFVKTLGLVPRHESGSNCARTDLKLNFLALVEICAMRPVFVLLPCLRSFNWRALNLLDKTMPVFLSLVGESLRRAQVDFERLGYDNRTAVSCALTTLSQHSPLLQRLEIGLASGLSVWAALEGFKTLKVFKYVTVPLTDTGMKTLASLPALTECAVALPKRPSFLENINQTVFPRLEKLSVAGTVDAYGPFSRAALFPAVTHFDFDITMVPRVRDLYRLFYAIRRQLCPERLEHLKVFTTIKPRASPDSEITTGENDARAIVRSTHFGSLFEFVRLRSFDFGPSWTYQVDDELFASMAKAWPLLETLSFGAASTCIHLPGGPTLRALSPFAVHCPNLKAIALHLDASELSADKEVTDDLYGELWADGRRTRSTSKVTRLRLQTSPIGLPREVAKFLSMVFPDLERVDASDSYYEETPGRKILRQTRQRKWGEVRQYIGLMRAARLDERY